MFQTKQRARILPLAGAAICALAAGITLAYGIAASATAYSHYGWAAAQSLGTIPMVTFWVFAFTGLIFGFFAISTWRKIVFADLDAFIQTLGKTGIIEVVRSGPSGIARGEKALRA